MKKLVFLIFCFTLSFSPEEVRSQVDTFQLTGKAELLLTAERTTYFNGEWIRYEIEIKNLLDDSLLVPHPRYGLRRIPQDPNGKYVPRGYSDDRFGGPRTMVLPPRSTWLSGGSFYPAISGPNPPLGTYTVYGTFGNLRSNTLYFQYTDLPANERLVKNEIAKASDIHYKFRIQYLMTLIKKYPNTIFLPDIYLQVLIEFGAYPENYDADLVMRTALECIDKMPDAIFSRTALDYYNKALMKKLGLYDKTKLEERDRKLLNDHLLELKKAYTGKRVAKYIDNLILTGE